MWLGCVVSWLVALLWFEIACFGTLASLRVCSHQISAIDYSFFTRSIGEPWCARPLMLLGNSRESSRGSWNRRWWFACQADKLGGEEKTTAIEFSGTGRGMQ